MISTNGRALVAFLDTMMGCSNTQIKIDKTVLKDATVQEMKTCCASFACKRCPILQRCSIADEVYTVSVLV